jgi:Tn3 transposase DDE domain-containing protein
MCSRPSPNAVDLLNQLITKCLARAEQTGEQVRLRTIHDLDAAAIRLNVVCKVVLDPQCEDSKLRSIIFQRIAKEHPERDSTTVDMLTRPEDDNYYEFLLGNYSTIRRFFPLLLRTVRIDLTDAILEIHGYTGFADQFTHISQNNARVDNLALSICAVLAAEACNIGIEPLVDPENPALTYGRLAWVQQNYIRAETLTRANARLVDAQSRIPLAQAFGGGEVASADGLRFVVPVRTLNAGPNSKYFHDERGVTYYNFASNQFSGFHGIVIPGTLHDSPYVLDGLMENQTSLEPKQLITDTAGYSDIVFALFWLLGYQFSPRLADIGESRFWRLDRTANYGALNGLASHRVIQI